MVEKLPVPDNAKQSSGEPRRYPSLVGYAAAVGLLTLGVAYLAGRGTGREGSASRRPASFALDLTDQVSIDPALIRYAQVAQFAVPLDQPRAIATDAQNRVYVAGDQAIQIWDAEGQAQATIALKNSPLCLTVVDLQPEASRRLYVGTREGIDVLASDHQPVASWPLPDVAAVYTSLAASPQDVFAADAGNRVIWRFSPDGEVRGQIGRADPARHIPGFVIPSPHFDIALGSEGLLHSVNPGKLQVMAFTLAGDYGAAWGEASSAIDGFFGCCNPAHLALLGDGRFVTSEKGIPRIKVYSAAGELAAVVAGPEQLGVSPESIGDPRRTTSEPTFDVAVDRDDRVLVLDPRDRIVRVFQAKPD